MTRPTDPTAKDVETLVHAIEAKEAATGPADGSPINQVRRPPSRPVEPPAVSPIAIRGPIPGLIDRQLWETLIVHEAQRQRRHGQSTAVVLAELTGLDALVERMGPAAVNRLVPSCAGLLVSLARASDRIARLATGRFGILLFEADDDGAERYAARATVATEHWLASSPWDVRLAVGWTATNDPEQLRRAVRTADEDLRTRQG